MLKSKTENKRNFGIDLAKILACVAVIGLHTVQREISYVNSSLYYLCGFAVPVFFMCSGYMLIGRKPDYVYSIRKSASILLLMLQWGAFVNAIKHICIVVNQKDGASFSIAEYLFDVFTGGLRRGAEICWHFWYLIALIIVYMLLPAINILLCNEKEKTVNVRRLLILWGMLVLFSVAVQLLSYTQLRPLQKAVNQPLRIWTWLQYFLLGSIARHCTEKLKGINFKVWAVVLSIAVCAAQNYMGRNVIHDMHAEYFYDSPLTIMWCFALFASLQNLRLQPKHQDIIQQLSAYTFGVYIIHPLLMRIVSLFVDKFSIIGGICYWILMTVTCFAIIHFVYSRKKLRKLIALN